MKDIFGVSIEIGDEVAFARSATLLRKGTVIDLTLKRVRVEYARGASKLIDPASVAIHRRADRAPASLEMSLDDAAELLHKGILPWEGAK